MKFFKTAMLLFSVLVLLASCGKETSKVTTSGGSSLAPILQSQLDEIQEQNNELYQQLIGTWDYYTDIPDVPEFDDYAWTFNEDGTFSENYFNWSGTFTVNDSTLILTMLSEGKEYPFKIEEEDGQLKLSFLRSGGEKVQETYYINNIDYYQIFIKQEE